MLIHRHHPKPSCTGRRGAVALALALPLLVGACTATAEQTLPTTSEVAALPDQQSLDAKIEALEAQYATRIGVTAVDPATGAVYSHRGDERFAMCSTFKAYASAAVLRKIEDGSTALDKTGGGGFGTANDAGVAWSPDGSPIVLAILTDSLTNQEDAQGNNEAIADTTAAVIEGVTTP
ncbi:serine hydrolase [Rhodococcus koreensis]